MRILSVKPKRWRRMRGAGGFTLTEMLVTMLILTLAATLLATGVPVAVDTYQKTVRSANAQVALSTTATALLSELSLASYADARNNKVCYVSREEGCALCIQNSDDSACRGLQKQYYTGNLADGVELSEDKKDGNPLALISNATITEDLTVAYDQVTKSADAITFTNLHVTDAAGNNLASVDEFKVLTRFKD